MINQQVVYTLAQKWISDREDFFIVDIKVTPSNSVIVEIDNYDKVTIDDCVDLSRFIEDYLDRSIEDYELEVGSAGLGQPFKVPEQYRKYIGEEVEFMLRDGQKQTGLLLDADEQGCRLKIKKKIKPEGSKRKIEVEEELSCLFEEIKYVKYLIRFK